MKNLRKDGKTVSSWFSFFLVSEGIKMSHLPIKPMSSRHCSMSESALTTKNQSRKDDGLCRVVLRLKKQTKKTIENKIISVRAGYTCSRNFGRRFLTEGFAACVCMSTISLVYWSLSELLLFHPLVWKQPFITVAGSRSDLYVDICILSAMGCKKFAY